MSASPDDADDSEWRFALDDVGEEAEEAADELAPERLDAENVAFVLLGVLLAGLVVFTAVAGNV